MLSVWSSNLNNVLGEERSEKENIGAEFWCEIMHFTKNKVNYHCLEFLYEPHKTENTTTEQQRFHKATWTNILCVKPQTWSISLSSLSHSVLNIHLRGSLLTRASLGHPGHSQSRTCCKLSRTCVFQCVSARRHFLFKNLTISALPSYKLVWAAEQGQVIMAVQLDR